MTGAFYRSLPCNLACVNPDRLDVLKALGDNTRYAIYLELARSAVPLATAQIAETLGLHPNTVRPHLERMREVGLLDVHVDGRGAVGRPQHRYSLAPDAPALGLEPPSFPVLARMLLRAASRSGVDAEAAAEAGREQGQADAFHLAEGRPCLDALVGELDRLGFDPAVVADEDSPAVTVGFMHCPFRDLAEANPDLVCSLHRGLVEGFVEVFGAEVTEFRSLIARDPCQVDVVVGEPG
jgi:predicted ArsR family transcriptional regulator